MPRTRTFGPDNLNRAALGPDYEQFYPNWGPIDIDGSGSYLTGGTSGESQGVRWIGAGQPSANQYSGAVMAGVWGFNGAAYAAGPMCRSTGQDATRTCYCLLIEDIGMTERDVRIIKIVNGTRTDLALLAAQTIGVGTPLFLEAETIGPNVELRGYIDAGSTPAITYTDTASPLLSGGVGWIVMGNAPGLDDLEGGNVSTAPPPAASLICDPYARLMPLLVR